MGLFSGVKLPLQYDITANDNATKVIRGVGRTASQESGKLTASFKRVGLAWAAAGALIAPAFKEALSAAQHSNDIMKQTATVLKSTGGAARVSMQGIADLSGALMRKTAIDDETIRTGANMLLTFTSIRNELGKGNDIFSQTTQVVTDMAAAMNNGNVTEENIRDTAIQVGKAMNDPIRGMTALRRVGVQFTDQQVEQVKAMMASGRQMDASKLILAELKKEFGGSAESFASPFKKLKTSLGELSETIGTILLPVATKLAEWGASAANWFSSLPGPVKSFAVMLASVAAIGVPLIGIISKLAVITKVWTAAQLLLNIALNANPIGLVITALAALAIGLKYAWDHSETFRRYVTAAWKATGDAVRLYGKIIQDVIGAVVAAFKWVVRTVTDMIDFFRQLPGNIRSAIGNVGAILYQKGKDIIQGLWNGLTFVWNKVTGWISGLARWIKDHKGPLSLDRRLLEPAGRAIMGGLRVGLLGGWTSVKDIISGAAGTIKDGFGGLLGKLGGAVGITVTGPTTAAMDYARKMLKASYNWGDDQWPALRALWQGESGWRWNARNPSSGAYGIPQALPAGKMASFGSDWLTNAATQINWGLSYIAQRYGSPANAYAFWLRQSPHWYDKGGILPPGITLAVNNTGHNEYVTNPALARQAPMVVNHNTYKITVAPTPLARPRDTGREIVNAILEFEQTGGRGWRKD